MEAARRFPGLLRSALLSLLVAVPALADDEATLQKVFGGKRVVLKLDMPAASTGVDVWPARERPVEFRRVASLIKKHGTGIRNGESQMVTKIRLHKSHVELQLGGGGYGTFGDLLTGPERVGTTANDKTAVTAEAAQANRAADAEERARRLAAGSRFNIRWKEGVPPEYATAEGIMKALAEYVDFTPMTGAAPTPGASGPMALKKGLTIEEVEKLLGPATAIATEKTGGLDVLVRSYETADQKVTAKFVSGVLVDFAIASK